MTMAKFIDANKKYKVKGILIEVLFALSSCYDRPSYNVNNKTGEISVMPSPEYKIHELVGEMINMIKNLEFEEID